MILRKWADLPDNLKNETIRQYYIVLEKKRFSLCIKRLFDLVAGMLIFLVLSPLFVVLSLIIKMDSKGSVFFRQIRVTQYGKQFRIFKFRTMVNNAEQIGTQVTTRDDPRVTKVGRFLRKYRLDEVPQLLNIIRGEMSFVGTRPEVVKYVEHYTEEMRATLLLPAGVTSEASIRFKDEERLLADAENTDDFYIKTVLPEKMRYNLMNLENFGFWNEILILIRTITAIFNRDSGMNSVYETVFTHAGHKNKVEVDG